MVLERGGKDFKVTVPTLCKTITTCQRLLHTIDKQKSIKSEIKFNQLQITRQKFK